MEINKQLFEDVLSGKLKGAFVLRNGTKLDSSLLKRNKHFVYRPFERPYGFKRNNACTYYDNGLSYIMGAYEFDIIDFIPDTDMKENELTIEIPEGKIVDWDESKKQNKIVLKDKQLTYDDICNKLQDMIDVLLFDVPSEDSNALVVDEHQLECILAKNKLANVAMYLNNGWKPNFSDRLRVFVLYNENDTLKVDDENSLYARSMGHTIFKLPELAKQAIEILGEETVKLALEPLGI